jgi:hypothetical protein
MQNSSITYGLFGDQLLTMFPQVLSPHPEQAAISYHTYNSHLFILPYWQNPKKPLLNSTQSVGTARMPAQPSPEHDAN